jgi:hypothetical protein
MGGFVTCEYMAITCDVAAKGRLKIAARPSAK